MDFKEAEGKCHELASRLASIPKGKRAKRLEAFLSSFPETQRESMRGYISFLVARNTRQGLAGLLLTFKEMKPQEQIRLVGFGCGILGLLLILIIAFTTRSPSAFQYWVVRVIMCLAGGAAAAGITGFVNLKGKVGPFVLAGGAGLAVTVILYFCNPPDLIMPHVAEEHHRDAEK